MGFITYEYAGFKYRINEETAEVIPLTGQHHAASRDANIRNARESWQSDRDAAVATAAAAAREDAFRAEMQREEDARKSDANVAKGSLHFVPHSTARLMRRPRWEYLTKWGTAEMHLDAFGAEGWELVSVVQSNADDWLYYFKRQVFA